ncbi:MAG: CusA/CzcA family heavy metal efflux RND transporter [Bacteroidia bacterium]|nr:CusA/CzcA family heavy metal efflux RND transporter [Bacteroidia bacterium]
MINHIILLSLKNKFIILLLVLALIITGILEFQKLPIDAVPDITNNQVQIITTAPSYAAQDIERKITFPIEQVCSNISGIKEIRSFSRFGLSLITIVFEDHIDIYWARQQVAERLQKIQNDIPSEIGKPELAPITTGLGEIYQYIVRPAKGYEKKYSLTDLREIQDWIIRRQLLGTKGVADVSSFGGKLKQYEITINPYLLNAYQITLFDVLEALEKNNQNTGSAYIEKHSTAYFIRTEGIITSIQDIENIVIRNTTAKIPIQIKDIAKIKIASAPRYGALVYTSKGADEQYEAAGGIVMMLKGENSNEVIERVKNKISEIQKILPEGVVIEPFLDRTKMVNSTTHTVFKNLIEGAVIVIIVLIFFLGNIPFGLLVASIIPLSMLFAVIMMNLFHVSGNLMSMGALDFGLIVDGAVIIVESVLYHFSKSSQIKKLSASISDKLVFTTSSRMMNAAVFGQIIILIVYLPVLYFSGIEGKMFRPMSQTVIFALAGAFLLSITYIPVMCSWIIRHGNTSHSHISDKMMNKIEQKYLRLFKLFFRNGKWLVISILVIFGTSIYLLIQSGGEFMPTLEEGDFAVETRLITGSGLSTTIEYCKQASALLAKEFPNEVEKIVSKIGSGEIPTDPMPIESADMMVILSPVQKWKKAKSFDELALKMQEKLQSIVGLSTSFQYPVQMRFNELIAGAKQDVVCKIFGENIDTLSKYAHLIAETVKQIKGTEGIYEEPIFGQPQIRIQWNREKLAQFNIDVNSANLYIKSVVAGNLAGQVYENERKFDITIRIDSTHRNIESIQNLPIADKNGNIVPLNQIAEIDIVTDINQIQREDAKRRIVVGFNVRGRDVESVINELKTKLESIQIPPGYLIKFGGSFENLESAKQRLMITVPAALSLIFLILYFSFSSFQLSVLVYSTIPMSVIGGIFFLYFRQMPFSISAGVGFIALFGIAVLNGIILVSEFERVKQKNTHFLKIVLHGIRARLRPVLMTATVASLGFFPMFINTDIGANVQRPLATVVIGGLLTSTLLTLFILPILYYHFILSKKKIFSNKIITGFIPLFALLLPDNTLCQIQVNYKMCVDSAIQNNKQIQMQNILSQYQKEHIKTGWNISKTNIQFQYGQYNSAFLDNSIQMQQSISFPTNYIHQKKLLIAEWDISELQKELLKKNIKATVGKLFYDIVILNEKIKILQHADSIYKENLKLIELQYKSGAISELEKNSMSNLLYENQMNLLEVNKNKKRLILLLQLITGIHFIQDIEYTSILAHINLNDTMSIQNHPAVRISEKNIVKQTHKMELEKSKLLPDFNVGYSNLSLTGWGSDNQYYPSSRRFQFVHLGVEVPIFFTSQSHKIKAEKHLIKFSHIQYEWEKQLKYNEFQKLIQEYFSNQKIIDSYEQNILVNLNKTKYLAHLNYQKGNINFWEWTNYTLQSIQSQLNYLNYIQQQNQIIFELQNFINN